MRLARKLRDLEQFVLCGMPYSRNVPNVDHNIVVYSSAVRLLRYLRSFGAFNVNDIDPEF